MRLGALFTANAAKSVEGSLCSVYGKSVVVQKMLVHACDKTAVNAGGRSAVCTFEVEMLLVRAVVAVLCALSDAAYEF